MFKGMGLQNLSCYCWMHYAFLFGFFGVIQNIFVTDTHVYKYMHVSCCGTGGFLKNVEIHVQTK